MLKEEGHPIAEELEFGREDILRMTKSVEGLETRRHWINCPLFVDAAISRSPAPNELS